MRMQRLADSLSEDAIRNLLKLKRQGRKVAGLKKALTGLLKKATKVAKQIAQIEGKGVPRPKRRISAAGRRRIAQAQKRRWAASKKKGKAA